MCVWMCVCVECVIYVIFQVFITIVNFFGGVKNVPHKFGIR